MLVADPTFANSTTDTDTHPIYHHTVLSRERKKKVRKPGVNVFTFKLLILHVTVCRASPGKDSVSGNKIKS